VVVAIPLLDLISFAFRYYRSLFEFGVTFAMLTLPLCCNSRTLETLKDLIMVKHFNGTASSVPLRSAAGCSSSLDHIVERWM
jgi:hypothetical protein